MGYGIKWINMDKPSTNCRIWPQILRRQGATYEGVQWAQSTEPNTAARHFFYHHGRHHLAKHWQEETVVSCLLMWTLSILSTLSSSWMETTDSLHGRTVPDYQRVNEKWIIRPTLSNFITIFVHWWIEDPKFQSVPRWWVDPAAVASGNAAAVEPDRTCPWVRYSLQQTWDKHGTIWTILG